MVRLYGITNCDTMRKARRWLDDQEIAHQVHDFKKQGPSEAQVRAWVSELGWDQMINRRGMMWRRLPAEVRNRMDEETAVSIMVRTPAIIRRPLLDTGTTRYLGFSAARYQEIFL